MDWKIKCTSKGVKRSLDEGVRMATWKSPKEGIKKAKTQESI